MTHLLRHARAEFGGLALGFIAAGCVYALAELLFAAGVRL